MMSTVRPRQTDVRPVTIGVTIGLLIFLTNITLVGGLFRRILDDFWNHAGIITVVLVLGLLWLFDVPGRLRRRGK